MPKRRKNDVPPDVPAIVPGDVFDGDDLSAEEIETEEKFQQFRSEIGDDEGYAYIYLKDVKGKLQYLDRLGKDQVSLPEIAGLYGGGRYVVRLFHGDGSRHSSYTINIDPRVKPKPVERDPVMAVATPGYSMSEIEMRMKMERLEGKLEGMAGGGGGIGQLKDIVAVIAPLMGPRHDGGVKELVGGLRDVMALSKDLGGGAESEDRGEHGFPWKTLLDRVEPLITLAVEQGGKPPVVTPAPLAANPPALPPGAPVTATISETPKAGGDTIPLWQRLVGAEIPKLVDLATKDKDPDLWADVYIESLEEKLPVTFFNQIEALAKTPNAVTEAYTRAVALWPQIAAHEQWMKDFLGALVEKLSEPDDAGNGVTGPKPEGLG